MAFCTVCGATVQGAFCQQCGTPASGAAVAPGGPPAGTPQTTPAAVAPVTSKVSPMVWILLAVVGVFALGIVGLIATGLFVAKTVVQNPGLVLGKIITAANPDAEVLSSDPTSQTMRIRDRKTGKEVTLSFDDIKKGRLRFSATGENGEVANMEIGGGEGKLPSWVPTYPGAKAQANVTAKGENADGMGEGGVVTFTTPDSPAKVTAFYESKCKEMGATVNLTQGSDSGGMVTCADDPGHRQLHVMVGASGGDTSFTVTYGRKR